jgi:FkbM family methyltransferase
VKRRRFKVRTNFIARHRRRWPLRKLARLCEKYLDAYANWSYDPARNGEQRLLGRMASLSSPLLFDVGANVGEWTDTARRLIPAAEVHCFEIAPATAEILRQRFAGDSRVSVTAQGLSAREEEVSLIYYPRASGLTSTLPFPHRQASERVQASTTTGDAYVAARGISRIEYCKIDVEGMEWEVLDGFSASLGAGVLQAIQFEYGRKSILTKHLLGDLYALLEGYGYLVGKVYPTYVDFRSYRLTDEDFRGPNYLAVRRERNDLIGLYS